jgi:topoisomerase-4 subunit A
MAEVVFAKERGKDRRENLKINLEEFIAIKGITALGNQLTKDKVNQINLLDSLPYEAPKEVHADDLEVVDETEVSPENSDAQKISDSEDDAQTSLF